MKNINLVSLTPDLYTENGKTYFQLSPFTGTNIWWFFLKAQSTVKVHFDFVSYRNVSHCFLLVQMFQIKHQLFVAPLKPEDPTPAARDDALEHSTVGSDHSLGGAEDFLRTYHQGTCIFKSVDIHQTNSS
jgi:hypothetical protein